MTTGLFVDGRRASSLPLPDRGFAYGDGIFETLLFRGREAAWLELHGQRLGAGLERLGIPEPPWRTHLVTSLEAADPAPDRWLAVRLTVTRGGGPRGYGPPAEPIPRTVIELSPAPRDPLAAAAPLHTALAALRWACQPALAGLKHLNRLEQVLAARECRARGLDELLVCDTGGAVIAATSANLFALHGDVLTTPDLTACGIAGTRRRLLLETLAPALGLTCRVQTLGPDAIETADGLFCCNSLRGIVAVGRYEQRQWRDDPMIERLQVAYREALCASVA
ncbi:aminodeoxychorismate lyase [Pseudohaliea rubra]|uniref:Aminodeoxychorismate lyase n=1 Tax=Pseudohaliea rubra DSM 19751 TaxID=1265313 RepID=A0A095XVA7_9GAMM|nr:aminodeoxychorismate lyase [Pseudohaliea rubra]KGE03581.1 Aminodeoxychorismate lyase [Pseudohaliea rubra DSM 19751]